MTSKYYLLFLIIVKIVHASEIESTENNSTEEYTTSDYTTDVPGSEAKSEVPGIGYDSAELRDKYIKVKYNESDEDELEIKPNSIAKEQLLRFRKFLNRKSVILKRVDAKADSTEEAGEKLIPKEIRQLNHIEEKFKENYPEKLSDVTAEDILPLLPRNLSSLIPLIHQLRDEKCQRHAEYFLQGLHNLTKWAVQSKYF